MTCFIVTKKDSRVIYGIGRSPHVAKKDALKYLDTLDETACNLAEVACESIEAFHLHARWVALPRLFKLRVSMIEEIMGKTRDFWPFLYGPEFVADRELVAIMYTVDSEGVREDGWVMHRRTTGDWFPATDRVFTTEELGMTVIQNGHMRVNPVIKNWGAQI